MTNLYDSIMLYGNIKQFACHDSKLLTFKYPPIINPVAKVVICIKTVRLRSSRCDAVVHDSSDCQDEDSLLIVADNDL